MIDLSPSDRRGQLVLLASATLAIALVPLALAYLQLGYHEDVGATGLDASPIHDGEQLLDRALQDAVVATPETHAWSDRTAAVTAVRDRLRPALSSLNRSSIERGMAYGVTYNVSRATSWARSHCPGGPDRQFGTCRADRGLVVQERAGRTHVLAVAVDLRATARDADWEATMIIRVSR